MVDTTSRCHLGHDPHSRSQPSLDRREAFALQSRWRGMSAGAWILITACAGALLFGGARVLLDGRFRGTHRLRNVSGPAVDPGAESLLSGTPWADELGPNATLLQFSSAFCAPCRTTR